MSIKRFIKRNVSSFFYFFKRINLPFIPPSPSFRVLLYHSISHPDAQDLLGLRVAPEAFYSQMEFLYNNHYRVYRLKDLVDRLINKQGLEEKSIGIAFDDGYKDNFTNAFPVLKHFSFPATIFLRADSLFGIVNKERYWDKWDYLSSDKIKEMLASSLIDVGSHAMNHKRLSALDSEALKEEVYGSKSMLENLLGRPVDLFSYPFGCLNNSVKDVIRNSGYKAAFSSFNGMNIYSSDRFELRRTEIISADGIQEVAKKIQAAYDWLFCFQKLLRFN